MCRGDGRLKVWVGACSRRKLLHTNSGPFKLFDADYIQVNMAFYFSIKKLVYIHKVKLHKYKVLTALIVRSLTLEYRERKANYSSLFCVLLRWGHSKYIHIYIINTFTPLEPWAARSICWLAFITKFGLLVHPYRKVPTPRVVRSVSCPSLVFCHGTSISRHIISWCEKKPWQMTWKYLLHTTV